MRLFGWSVRSSSWRPTCSGASSGLIRCSPNICSLVYYWISLDTNNKQWVVVYIFKVQLQKSGWVSACNGESLCWCIYLYTACASKIRYESSKQNYISLLRPVPGPHTKRTSSPAPLCVSSCPLTRLPNIFLIELKLKKERLL